MSKNSSFKITLSLFLFSILFAGGVWAQTNSCAIAMEVSRYNSENLIAGATATAINDETKKVYRSVLKKGQPYFANLPKGDYRVTVSKAGYMRSANYFSLPCSEDTDEYPWDIELYKGSSKLLVKLYNRPDAVPDKIETIRILNVERPTMIGSGDPTAAPSLPPAKTPAVRLAPRVISGGVVNGKATNLVKPPYPAAARTVRASGQVNVQVTIDEDGNVISATAISGHPLLRQAAVNAAKASKFSKTLLSGQPVRVTGVVVYNFVP